MRAVVAAASRGGTSPTALGPGARVDPCTTCWSTPEPPTSSTAEKVTVTAFLCQAESLPKAVVVGGVVSDAATIVKTAFDVSAPAAVVTLHLGASVVAGDVTRPV